MCAISHMWSQDSSWNQFFPSIRVGWGTGTQVFRLGSKYLIPQSHIIGFYSFKLSIFAIFFVFSFSSFI